MVPIYAIALVIPHAGKQDAAGLSLLDNVFDYLRTPVIVLPVIQGVFSDANGVSRTEDHTPMTANAVFLLASDLIISRIIMVHVETALIDAHLALDAAV